MKELDVFYTEILQMGFVVLRQALEAKDMQWMSVEIEFLHNIPSLIGEENIGRHKYFWECEQSHYSHQINLQCSELAKSRMRTYYLPILARMKPCVEKIIRLNESNN
jgi:hypothetical protein